MLFVMVLQLMLLIATVGIIIYFSLSLRKGSVMHNKCYTDNLQIEMTHGNVEPHI
tara:strand:+ start:36 stop:200 length:165 start_codon:yes stop_codon:yes gene_type:complete